MQLNISFLNVKDENGDWTIKGIASAASIIYGNDVCNGKYNNFKWFIFYLDYNFEFWFQGNNLGTNNTGLFTRVSAFKHWILKTLKHDY